MNQKAESEGELAARQQRDRAEIASGAQTSLDSMDSNIDFTDPDKLASLDRARPLLLEGFRILREEVGARKPSENAFLREAQICAEAGLTWSGERGGANARTAEGLPVEIMTTRTDAHATVQFATSRTLTRTVIDRYRRAELWLFGVFDPYERMVALYSVDRAGMQTVLNGLSDRVESNLAEGKSPPNNPKIKLPDVRGQAAVLSLDPDYAEAYAGTSKGWTLRLP